MGFVMKKHKNLGKVAAEFIEKLEAKGGQPIYKLPVKEAREILDNLQKDAVNVPNAHIQDLTVPGDGGQKLSIRIIRPANEKGRLPVVMYIHGGGWILGNKDTHDRLVREIAVSARVAIVFVNYTPSPEAKYPTAIEEAYGATTYIAKHGEELNLDTSFLAIAGDSVGGNMAIATALLAKERKGPKIDYLMLFYPVTDSNFETASYNEFADGPWLTKAAMKWFWDAYEPNLEARKKSTLSPLQAPLEQLKGLPSTLLITDENDVLRDEGEAFAHKLMDAGVKVSAVRYEGMIHDFLLLNDISHSPAVRSALTLISASLQDAISKKKSSRERKAA